MKKTFRILRSVFGWLFLFGLLVVDHFALLAFVFNIEWLKKDLGLVAVLCAIVLTIALALLFLYWLCRSYGRRRTFYTLGSLAVVIMLFYAEEDWRGWRAWQQFKQQAEAAGERLDFASLVPPPIPNDQNFALTPILVSSYADRLGTNGHKIDPWLTNVVNRMHMTIFKEHDDARNQPTNGSWATGTLTDLKAWQVYYRTPKTYANHPTVVTNQFPVSAQPQSPAEDVLFALGKYDSNIEELRQASRLPLSRFPLNYDADNPYFILSPHISYLKQCVQVLQLRALAELEMGQTAKSLEDIKLALRLGDSVRSQPLLLSQLVRISEFQIILQPIYEGLSRNEWTDAELTELQRELSKLDFLSDYQLAMRSERNAALTTVDVEQRNRNIYKSVLSSEILESSDEDVDIEWSGMVFSTLYHLLPSGWFWLNKATIGDIHQRWLIGITDSSKHRIFPTTARQEEENLDNCLIPGTPWNMFAVMLMPALSTTGQKFGYAQNAVDMAQVACALGRYRISHGEYPDSLAGLSPQFMGDVPHDVVSGQPLKYHRTNDGRFVLYSIGWNETDDSGKVVFKDTPPHSVDIRKGDWVWEYPAN
jgi:hypothetical protein